MKKVIGGKVYDTTTARQLARIDTGSTSDLSFWCETLYQKRTGEYFLHGEGGPMSRYARSIDQNSWGWGEKITPLSAESARKWAEEHLSVDRYEAIFGLPSEDDARVAWSLHVPAAVDAKARAMAAERGISLSALVVEILSHTLQ